MGTENILGKKSGENKEIDTNEALLVTTGATEEIKIIFPSISQSLQMNNIVINDDKNDLFHVEKDKEENKERLLKIFDWEGKTLKEIEEEYSFFKETGTLPLDVNKNVNNAIQTKKNLPCNNGNACNKGEINGKLPQLNPTVMTTLLSYSVDPIKSQQTQQPQQLQSPLLYSQNNSQIFWKNKVEEGKDVKDECASKTLSLFNAR